MTKTIKFIFRFCFYISLALLVVEGYLFLLYFFQLPILIFKLLVVSTVLFPLLLIAEIVMRMEGI